MYIGREYLKPGGLFTDVGVELSTGGIVVLWTFGGDKRLGYMGIVDIRKRQQLIYVYSFYTLSCTGHMRGVKGVQGVQGVSMKSGRFNTSTHHQQSSYKELVHAANASCTHLLEFLMLQNDIYCKYHRRLWV